eukprot:SAG31_NODE_4535_length_3158_cov_1.518143_2_plen_350_part_00
MCALLWSNCENIQSYRADFDVLILDAAGAVTGRQVADVRSELSDNVVTVGLPQMCSSSQQWPAEVDMCPSQCHQCPLRNVALHAATDHSSCYSTARCSSNLVDGQLYFQENGARDWLVGDGSSDSWRHAWVIIDLGGPQMIKKARVFNQNEYSNTYLDRDASVLSIDASNDREQWTSILVNVQMSHLPAGRVWTPETNPGDLFIIPDQFQTQPFQFWRITIRESFGDSFSGLMEIMLLAEECSQINECTEGDANICPAGTICADAVSGFQCVPVATSCLAHKQYIESQGQVAADGPYSIQLQDGLVTSYCDMSGGGWTLVGKIFGRPTSMSGVWLRCVSTVLLLCLAPL